MDFSMLLIFVNRSAFANFATIKGIRKRGFTVIWNTISGLENIFYLLTTQRNKTKTFCETWQQYHIITYIFNQVSFSTPWLIWKKVFSNMNLLNQMIFICRYNEMRLTDAERILNKQKMSILFFSFLSDKHTFVHECVNFGLKLSAKLKTFLLHCSRVAVLFPALHCILYLI